MAVAVPRELNVVVPRRRFHLETDRLTIRMLTRGDITAFTHYRKLPVVARYQDWPQPYTRDLAHALVDEMDTLAGPTEGGWVQLAVDLDGRLIGDVAVWLDEDGTLAMIGYTLDPDHHGRGYTVESVNAVIHWLFRRQHVHRIAATIDPRNFASARVLERCGFEHIGTAPAAAFNAGEWSDDARFSLLQPAWEAWCTRPTGPPKRVELVELDRDNLQAVINVEAAFSQRRFVAPVLRSLAQALIPPVDDGETIRPWYRGVAADGDIVGFVMVAEPTTSTPHPYLWRFLIDHHHQGRGVGRLAIEQLLDQRRADGHTHLLVSYVDGVVGSPAPFYLGLGFVPTGKIDDGETEAILAL